MLAVSVAETPDTTQYSGEKLTYFCPWSVYQLPATHLWFKPLPLLVLSQKVSKILLSRNQYLSKGIETFSVTLWMHQDKTCSCTQTKMCSMNCIQVTPSPHYRAMFLCCYAGNHCWLHLHWGVTVFVWWKEVSVMSFLLIPAVSANSTMNAGLLGRQFWW